VEPEYGAMPPLYSEDHGSQPSGEEHEEHDHHRKEQCLQAVGQEPRGDLDGAETGKEHGWKRHVKDQLRKEILCACSDHPCTAGNQPDNNYGCQYAYLSEYDGGGH